MSPFVQRAFFQVTARRITARRDRTGHHQKYIFYPIFPTNHSEISGKAYIRAMATKKMPR